MGTRIRGGVVVGVLFALLAAEWAGTRRAKAEAEQAVDALARELQTISGVMYFGLQGWECQNMFTYHSSSER